MVLKYMVTDTDLEKGETGQPATEASQPEAEVEQPEKKSVNDWRIRAYESKRNVTPPKKNMKFWFFLMAIAVLGAAAYYLWTTDRIPSSLDFLPTTANKIVVTAIVHGEENASAVVSGRVVREGDTIDGYKVVSINKDNVEFEKNGKRFTKQVYE